MPYTQKQSRMSLIYHVTSSTMCTVFVVYSKACFRICM
jgi:hypothetical protein